MVDGNVDFFFLEQAVDSLSVRQLLTSPT